MLEEKGVVYIWKFTSGDIAKVLSIKVRENSEYFLSIAFFKRDQDSYQEDSELKFREKSWFTSLA